MFDIRGLYAAYHKVGINDQEPIETVLILVS